MKQIISNFKLKFKNTGRNTDEHSEAIDEIYTDFWKQATSLLKTHCYEHEGCKAEVIIDWSPVLRLYRTNRNVMRQLETKPKLDLLNKFKHSANLSATVTLHGKNSLSDHAWYPEFFLELAVYQSFLEANLSVPGAADFYSLSLPSKNIREFEPRLSGFLFELWFVDTFDGKWPLAKQIPLQDVITWYDSLKIGLQKAGSSLERTIFSLYYLCKGDNQIDTILWFFHGLEALLATRVGENISGIVRRVESLLELTPPQAKILNKRIRELYSLRSSFVHGGYSIPHPINSDVIDRSLDEDFGELFEAVRFGFNILCAVLQKVIQENYLELNYKEVLVPKIAT